MLPDDLHKNLPKYLTQQEGKQESEGNRVGHGVMKINKTSKKTRSFFTTILQ